MDKTFDFIEDIGSVMERLGGNGDLLVKLLGKFHGNYAKTRVELVGMLERGERDEAYRLVHSIKGVSANLGFGKLYGLAMALESRMKAGEYSPAAPETLAFLDEVDRIASRTSPTPSA